MKKIFIITFAVAVLGLISTVLFNGSSVFISEANAVGPNDPPPDPPIEYQITTIYPIEGERLP